MALLTGTVAIVATTVFWTRNRRAEMALDRRTRHRLAPPRLAVTPGAAVE